MVITRKIEVGIGSNLLHSISTSIYIVFSLDVDDGSKGSELCV